MMMIMIEINDEINELLAHTTLEEQRQVKFLNDMDSLISSVDASMFEVGSARARWVRFDRATRGVATTASRRERWIRFDRATSSFHMRHVASGRELGQSPRPANAGAV